jgi:hypothetical protein
MGVKGPVTQVVLLKTGIFALPAVFVEKAIGKAVQYLISNSV